VKKTPSYAATVADVVRRYWPLWIFAGTVLAGAVLFAGYLTNRANLADRRNEKQRAAICAILQDIPGQVPVEIRHARRVFARPGHPGDCAPIRGAVPKPQKVRVVINGHPATIIVNPPQPSPSPSPSRRPVGTAHRNLNRSPHTAHHRHKHRHGHRTPHPSPSPSPTCLILGHICR
jgi:hypothetical protein